MGVCFGPMVWLWLAVYIMGIAMLQKRWRLYWVNGLFIVGTAARLVTDGFETAIAGSGGAFVVLVVAVNVAIWADNFDESA